ncbi:TonB-dependent receptor [Croceiramulus getboli]|nr:TonB-dependent receptor [Flavobacteriaceae bacterium YJPT1-3]
MKPITTLFFLLLISWTAAAQEPMIISGTVTQKDGTPIMGANVYLEGTYDGATTQLDGSFQFETTEDGVQTLLISFVGFETYTYAAPVAQLSRLTIQLQDDLNALDAVVLSAGTFRAGGNSTVTVLKPLDVVTTASALGDFVGALQTLPGTTTVAEDGRLFVRGGDAGETQIFIDGIRVFTPYTPTTNNLPARGRYSPFLFDGITFSTGGYSAEYGQALSSVLLLNTEDEPAQEKTDIAIMTVGGGLGNTQKWERSSLSFNTSYINLAPYLSVFEGRDDWEKPFETFAGESVFRYKTDQGLFKFYTAFDHTNFALTQEDINLPEGLDFSLKNSNLYSNASYSGRLSDTWTVNAGASYTYAKNDLGIMESEINNDDHSIHLKAKLRKRFSNRVKLSFGAEQFFTSFGEQFETDDFSTRYGYNNHLSAAFAEADFLFSKKLAAQAGIRGTYSELFKELYWAPRFSLAYKVGKKSQVSLALGNFFQQPQQDILKFADNLEAARATHYIANYQYVANDRIFRAEVYRKDYQSLVTYDTEMPGFNSTYASNGEGYAQGFDLFFRDNKSIKNLDYWVSYSYLDTERQVANYPIALQPPFANNHNFSVVGKYFIDDWRSQVGLSYQFASGRPYTNPNDPGFLQERTKNFNSLSLNWAWLVSDQKILYFSVNNVLGVKNVNGYQYANTPNMDGIFDRRALRPGLDQFFFVGFFWTISEDGKDNQLNNL